MAIQETPGISLTLSYWPMQNLQFAAPHADYTRLNSGAINYDGANRNATGNNTIYLLARFIF
jgi:hypothetical protein